MAHDRQNERQTQDLDERLMWRGEYRAGEFYYRNHVVRDPATGILWRARQKTVNYAPPAAATLNDPTWDLHAAVQSGSQIVGLIDAELGSAAWQGGAGSGAVPHFIPAGSTFFIAANNQALYAIPIDAEGVIDGDGVLVEVAA